MTCCVGRHNSCVCVCVYYTFCPVFVYANNMKVQVETTSINSQNSFDWRNAFHTESGISFLSCQDMYVWTIAFWWKFKDKHTFSWEKIDFGSVSRDKIYQILYTKYGDTRDSWQLVWETYIVTWMKKCGVFWDKLRTKILATSFYNFLCMCMDIPIAIKMPFIQIWLPQTTFHVIYFLGNMFFL